MSSRRWSARVPIVIGSVAAVFLVAGIGAWSVQTEISGAVISNGTLQVENDSQVVQHPDGGVVAQILVREGDTVVAGQPLIQLDATFLESELSVLESQLAEIYARKSRLRSERDGLVEFRSSTRPTYTFVSDETFNEQVTGQKSLFKARLTSIERGKEQIKRQKEQVAEKVRGLKVQLSAFERQLLLMQDQISRLKSLSDRGLAELPRLLELQQSEAELQGRIGSLRADIAESEMRGAALELEALRLDDERREEAITGLRDLEVNERELVERRIALREQLGRLSINAPVSGVVFGSTVSAERAVIRGAEPIMYLVPKDQPLHAVARIEPVDVDQVFSGQDVALVFSAFSRRTTPEGQGTVSFVSADATLDDMTGQPFYEARIGISSASLESLEGLQLIPGMPVEIYIKTDKRTPISYLVQPLAVYFARAFREE